MATQDLDVPEHDAPPAAAALQGMGGEEGEDSGLPGRPIALLLAVGLALLAALAAWLAIHGLEALTGR